MQFPDFELSFTAATAAHVTDFQNAVTLYLAADNELPQALNRLLDSDPEMPMALCLQGYLLKLAAHPAMQDRLDQLVAQALATAAQANPRERAHIAAFEAWNQGDANKTLTMLEQITAAHPQDMVALRVAHYLHFYNGSGLDMAASTDKVLPFWPQDHPHYSFLLGMHAFGLEESGDYRRADELARQALMINRHDLWSIHAVAHVHYMQGRHSAGIDWLTEHSDELIGTNNFRNHLHWHQALHHFSQADYDQVLAIYDRELTASVQDDFYLDLCNNAALLWRCEEMGVDVGSRWQPLAEIAMTHLQDRELVFASLHYLLPLLRTAPEAASSFISNLKDWGRQANHQGNVAATVGIPAAQQLQLRQAQQVQERPDLTAEVPTVPDLHRIGGSVAQRELFIAPASL